MGKHSAYFQYPTCRNLPLFQYGTKVLVDYAIHCLSLQEYLPVHFDFYSAKRRSKVIEARRVGRQFSAMDAWVEMVNP